MTSAHPKNGTDVLESADSTPFSQLPDWAKNQLGEAAAFLFPNEHDPDAELLVDHVRYLRTVLANQSDRLAYEGDFDSLQDGVPYEPFPVEVLPEALSEYVLASANAIPCPPGMVAMPLLGVLSGAVGASARLCLKRTWKEIPVLWTAVVAPSGSTKSPAADYALRPIYRREKFAAEKYERELADYKAAIEDGKEAKEPTRTRYRMGDVTREAVAQVLSDNPRGVLLARDELATWLGSFDRYANGSADLHAWLAFYEGRQETVDRVGGGNVTLSNPAVPVTGTIQPGTLKSKLTDLHFETGFAPRLLLCKPPVEPRQWTESDVTKDVESRYEAVLDHLYEIPLGTEVEFSPEAKELWVDWFNTANKIVHNTPEGPAHSVASKTIGHAARLTLLLHLAKEAQKNGKPGEWGAQNVSPAIVKRATKLARWLRNETLRVYDDLNLVKNAVPPIIRFLQQLPEEFRTVDAKEVAGRDEIPRRTMFDWLSRLQEQGEIEKIKRGLYRKV